MANSVVEILLILALSMHLLAANVASGGPLLAVVLQWRATRRADPAARRLARQLVIWSMAALGVAILLGGAALGLVWMSYWDRFISAAARIPASRYWFAIVELVFYFACLAIVVRLSRSASPSRSNVVAQAILAVAAATNLLAHFPPLFGVIVSLEGEPSHAAIHMPDAIMRPDVLAIVVHFTIASLAVAGLAAATIARCRAAPTATESMDRLQLFGSRTACAATLAQLVAGAVVLLCLPTVTRDRLIGVDARATALFGAAIIAAIGLMHRLAIESFEPVGRRELARTAALLTLVVALMVGAQHRARGHAARGGSAESNPVKQASRGQALVPAPARIERIQRSEPSAAKVVVTW